MSSGATNVQPPVCNGLLIVKAQLEEPVAEVETEVAPAPVAEPVAEAPKAKGPGRKKAA